MPSTTRSAPKHVIKAQQGYFGNVNRSHGVIAFSCADKALEAEILPRSDRPFGNELDGRWPSFIWGRPLSHHYLIMRTFSDVHASRAGMVFTHAIAIPMAEAIHITDLRLVFAHLATDIQPPGQTLDPLLLKNESDEARPASVLHEATVSRFLTSQASVCVGNEAYLDLVTAMWWGLPPALRRSFSFGMCMTADNLDEQGFQVAFTPAELQRRWPSTLLVAPHTTSQPVSAAEGMLLGRDNRIPGLLEDLGIQLVSLEQLQNLDKVAAYLTLPSLGFDQLRALISRIDFLTPDPSQGSVLKSRLAADMEKAIRLGTVADLKKLRNFDLHGFSKQTLGLWVAVQNTVQRYLESAGEAAWTSLAELIVLSLDHPDSTWSTKIHAGFQAWAQHASTLKFVWALFDHAPSLSANILSLLPMEPALQDQLLKSINGEHDHLALRKLIPPCTQRKWYQLHGEIVGTIMPAREAFLAQGLVDTNPDYLLGMGRIAEKLPKDEFFKVAQELTDDRLIELATMYCQRDLRHGKLIDLTNQRGRHILLRWLNSRPDDRNILRPQMVHELLTLLLQGTEIEVALLRHLLNHGQGNLIHFPDRQRIWDRFPIEVRSKFLEATALGWIEDAKAHPNHIETPETLLKSTLEQAPIIRHHLSTCAVELALLVGIFNALPGLSESTLVAALQNRLLTGSEFDAPQLGQLILNRRWENAASKLFEQRHQKRWIQPALPKIHSLLGFFKRLELSISPGLAVIPESEFWSQLEKFVIDLYPKGPDKLFEKLDWNESDLSNNDSRKEQWAHVIRLTRRGKDGYTVLKLLKGMLQDHLNNDKLRLLKDYAENHRL